MICAVFMVIFFDSCCFKELTKYNRGVNFLLQGSKSENAKLFKHKSSVRSIANYYIFNYYIISLTNMLVFLSFKGENSYETSITLKYIPNR